MSEGLAIPLWTDLAAIGIGSLSGTVYATESRERRLDLLGIAIIGIAAGFGGGVIRDLMLSEVPAALQSNWYFPVAIAAALLGILLEHVFRRLGHLVTTLDALTLGVFGAVGTAKALSAGLPVVPAIFLGAVTAVGGSIIRDVLLGAPIALMYVGSLYATGAIVGSAAFVGLTVLGVDMWVGAVVCIAVTFAVRMLAVAFGWSLPDPRSLRRGRGRPPAS